MNLALKTIAAAEANVVVHIRRSIVQVGAKRASISPIVPIAATFHSAPLITIQSIPMKEH